MLRGDSMPTDQNTNPAPPVDQKTASAPPIAKKSPGDGAAPVEFLPYVDEMEEKKKFWQAVFITLAVFFVLGVVVFGFVISQRLSRPATTSVSVSYIDSATPNPTNFPTRAPTKTPVPDSFAPITSQISPPIGLTRIPTRRPTQQAQVPLITQGASPTPTSTQSSSIPTATRTPTPITSTPTPTSGLLPTMTPTGTVTNTPTSTPLPTPNLVTSVDSYNFGSVLAGTTTTVVFQLYNTGTTFLTISEIGLATGGSSNPYSIVPDGVCIIDTPTTIANGAYKCVRVQIAPTYSTVNTNYLQIFWGGSNVKNITLTATVPTPTPTPTPG